MFWVWLDYMYRSQFSQILEFGESPIVLSARNTFPERWKHLTFDFLMLHANVRNLADLAVIFIINIGM